MIQITLPSGEYLLVAVPEGANGNDAWLHDDTMFVHLGFGSGFIRSKNYIVLPDGNYTILGLASAITEDVAAGIVEGKPNAWIDYENKFNGVRMRVFKAAHSLHSLVRSHGYEPEHCLILKID